MNQYCTMHWKRYLAGNLDSLWRIAFDRNWLKGEQELQGYLTPDRIQEIEQLCRIEILAAEMLQQLRKHQVCEQLKKASVSQEAIEQFCRVHAAEKISKKLRTPTETLLANSVTKAAQTQGVPVQAIGQALSSAVEICKQQESIAKGVAA